jgi:hypothetical protein
MTKRRDHANLTQQRARIAGVAARLISENGISDYALAKRKAAQSLGLPENTQLPENSEVETELRSFHRLFHDKEQTAAVARLRQKACEVMTVVQRFVPYLTGAVLDGTASRYAEIDIQLFTDSAKDVEIFLLNEKIDYEHSTPRSDRAEAVLTLHSDGIPVNLIVYPSREERITYRTRDGRVRPRARLDAVNKLVLAAAQEAP